MFQSVVCGALLALLAACAGEYFNRSPGAAPVGTDAATGRPYVTARGAMNRDYHIGADPNFPEPGMSGRR
jgi:hypothetical protein